MVLILSLSAFDPKRTSGNIPSSNALALIQGLKVLTARRSAPTGRAPHVAAGVPQASCIEAIIVKRLGSRAKG
jgi:hypothetical protein